MTRKQQIASNRETKPSAVDKWLSDLGLLAEEAWWYVWEIVFVLFVAGASLVLRYVAGLGWPTALILDAAAFNVLFCVSAVRRVVLGVLRTARARRRLRSASRDCDVPRIRVRRAEPVSVGERISVRWARGSSFEDVEAKREQLAACLHVRELRIERDPANASRGTVTLVRSDPLAELGGHQWPLA